MCHTNRSGWRRLAGAGVAWGLVALVAPAGAVPSGDDVVIGSVSGTVVALVTDFGSAPPGVEVGDPWQGTFQYPLVPSFASDVANGRDYRFPRGALRFAVEIGNHSWVLESDIDDGVTLIESGSEDRYEVRVAGTTYVAFPGSLGDDTFTGVYSIDLELVDDAPPFDLLQGLDLPTGAGDLDPAAATSLTVEVFTLDVLLDDEWTMILAVDQLALEPRKIARYCQTGPNSSGFAAHVGVQGSTSVSANAAILTATGSPAATSGQFFYGPDQSSQPFGNGTLCIDPPGGIYRLNPPVVTTVFGSAMYALDFDLLPAAAAIVPGSTWNFQFWFRDPGAGGADFDLSDAMNVLFTP